VRAAQGEGWMARGVDWHPKLPVANWLDKVDFCNGYECRADVVWLHHVLHATPHPMEMLQKALKMLTPGGTLVLTSPNPQSPAIRQYVTGSTAQAFPSPRILMHLLHQWGYAPVRVVMNEGKRDSGHPYQDDFRMFIRQGVPLPEIVDVTSLGQEVHR
jgi:SAM-dependent methyltransferase